MGSPETVLVRARSLAPEATEAAGELLGAAVEPGTVIGLDGELGAGKTCFVRGLARGLGVREPVSSPTFALMNTYPGRLPLYHFDAWRSGAERAYLDDGGGEWIGEGGVAVIEWSPLVSDHLPEARLEVRLRHVAPEERLVEAVWTGSADPPAALRRWARGLSAVPELRIDGAGGCSAHPAG